MKPIIIFGTGDLA